MIDGYTDITIMIKKERRREVPIFVLSGSVDPLLITASAHKGWPMQTLTTNNNANACGDRATLRLSDTVGRQTHLNVSSS